MRVLGELADTVHPVADVLPHHQLGHLRLYGLRHGERIGEQLVDVVLIDFLRETPLRIGRCLIARL
ncbi:hypothetical protein, partial [Exiguobacterium sp. SH3S3]|uniref:hypothetical protein n=1 Tax=Exiguobacterium sp. SH3S3 TaxID=2510957 RepID=UPI001F48CE86